MQGAFHNTTAVIIDYDTKKGTDWIVSPFHDMIGWSSGFIYFLVKGEEDCSKCVLTARGASDYDIPSLTEFRLETNNLFGSPVCIKAFKIICN